MPGARRCRIGQSPDARSTSRFLSGFAHRFPSTAGSRNRSQVVSAPPDRRTERRRRPYRIRLLLSAAIASSIARWPSVRCSSTREAQQRPLVRHCPVGHHQAVDDVAQHASRSCTAAPHTRRTIRSRPADARSSARTPDASPRPRARRGPATAPKKIGSNGQGVQLALTTCTAYRPAQFGANARRERGGHREQPAAVADGAVGGAGLRRRWARGFSLVSGS